MGKGTLQHKCAPSSGRPSQPTPPIPLLQIHLKLHGQQRPIKCSLPVVLASKGSSSATPGHCHASPTSSCKLSPGFPSARQASITTSITQRGSLRQEVSIGQTQSILLQAPIRPSPAQLSLGCPLQPTRVLGTWYRKSLLYACYLEHIKSTRIHQC